MRRRRFVQAIVGAPSAAALFAQQQQITRQPEPPQPAPGIPLNPTQPVQPPAGAAREAVQLVPSIPDAAAEMLPRFFTQPQFSALRKLSAILSPPLDGKPGALEARAPEFLDFLIGQSPSDRQELYRAGLDALNSEAMKKFGKDFAALEAQQADTLLVSLRQPWTFEAPADPVANFLRAAKQDVRTATTNSREYAMAAPAAPGARRMNAGGGLYWYPLD